MVLLRTMYDIRRNMTWGLTERLQIARVAPPQYSNAGKRIPRTYKVATSLAAASRSTRDQWQLVILSKLRVRAATEMHLCVSAYAHAGTESCAASAAEGATNSLGN
jgi:hypothetical protein